MNDAPAAPASALTYLFTGQVHGQAHPSSAPLPGLGPIVRWAAKELDL